MNKPSAETEVELFDLWREQNAVHAILVARRKYLKEGRMDEAEKAALQKTIGELEEQEKKMLARISELEDFCGIVDDSDSPASPG